MKMSPSRNNVSRWEEEEEGEECKPRLCELSNGKSMMEEEGEEERRKMIHHLHHRHLRFQTEKDHFQ